MMLEDLDPDVPDGTPVVGKNRPEMPRDRRLVDNGLEGRDARIAKHDRFGPAWLAHRPHTPSSRIRRPSSSVASAFWADGTPPRRTSFLASRRHMAAA